MRTNRRRFLGFLGWTGSAALPAGLVHAQNPEASDLVGQLPTQLDVRQFGAKGDGTTDDTQAVLLAIEALRKRNGGTLIFPATAGGYVLKSLVITADNVTLDGTGTLIVSQSISLRCSNFTARNLKLIAPSYHSKNRGFICVTHGLGENSPSYANFMFENLQFEGFFYATCLQAIDYSAQRTAQDGFISEVSIINCRSKAPQGRNAGHFQHIGVTNVLVSGNRTYGGQMASSYNFINSNGTISITNNYDENNSYASCEVENSSHRTIITGNQFGREIWIDDSCDAIIIGNIARKIQVTIQTSVCEMITIANNHCESISLGVFGGGHGTILNANIQSNMIRHQEATPKTWGILVTHTNSVMITHNQIIGGPSKYSKSIGLSSSNTAVVVQNLVHGAEMSLHAYELTTQ